MGTYINSLYLICLALTSSIGFLALKQNYTSPINRSFFFFALGTTLWMVSLYLGFYFAAPETIELSNTFFRIAFAGGVVFIFSLTRFFYLYPNKTVSFPRIFEHLFLLASAVLFYVCTFTPLVYESVVILENGELSDILGKWYSLFLGYTFFNYGVEIFLSIKKIRKTRGLEQKKIILAFVGLFTFIFLVIMTNAILPLFDIIIFQAEAVSFSLLFLIPGYYSIQRYRFFDFSFVSLKIGRYIILISAFVVIDTVLLVLLETQINKEYSFYAHIFSGLTALFIFFKLEKIFPEFISSSFREFRYTLDQLKSSIYYCNNYSELLKKIETTFILRLHFSSVQLFLIREKKNHIQIPIYYADHFSRSIEQKKLKVLVSEELKLQKEKNYLEKMKKLNASICFPLYLDTKLIGFFLLGNRSNKKSYSREEINELMKAKQFIELCFINILLQSDLKEENDLMKQLIHEKTKNLKKQNEKIKQLLNQQSDFIAVTAHEFRTPLNIALLQLEDTLDSYDHSSQVLEDMKVLENSLDKLKHLTQNLFDVQQYDLKKAKLHTKEIDIHAFVAEVFEEFKDMTAQKKIDLALDNRIKSPVFMKIDELKIRQVLYNLLTNAQKFIPEQAKIIIRIKETPKWVNISVIDNGPGISDKDKKRVFQKFQTNNTHMGMGIGLGLYLCKQIVDLHKGEITVSDTPGGGATFTISLPKKAERTHPVKRIKSVKRIKA